MKSSQCNGTPCLLTTAAFVVSLGLFGCAQVSTSPKVRPSGSTGSVGGFGGGLSGPQGFNPNNALIRLDEAVPLTTEQKSKAIKIFEQEAGALNAIPAEDRPEKGAEFRQTALAQIRALLTPEQQRKYDRTPQSQGGGLSMMSPENSVARLDRIVSLSNAQKKEATEIFGDEIDEVGSLAPQDRKEKGMVIRQAANEEVRGLLTPEQQQKLDAVRHETLSRAAEVRAVVASYLRSSPNIAVRVGAVTRLSLLDSSDVSIDGAVPTSGTFSYKVRGSTTTETLKIHWKRSSPDAPVKVVRIEGSGGQIIQPQ
jgi:hypothetical protein